MPARDSDRPDEQPTSFDTDGPDATRAAGAGDTGETATSGGDAPPPPSLKRLGDFELLRELGRGGMGVVYEARQVSLKRRVALKVLPPAMGLSPQAKQRFEREAQAAAKLHHTNIVPVHAIGNHDGHHFYAMDLIEGQSLDHVLRDVADQGTNPLLDQTVPRAASELTKQPASASDPVPVTSSNGGGATSSLGDTSAGSRPWFDAVAKLIAEVADGLDYAHGHGVIHRDIKPANLMLSSEGRLCITDFGLARIAQEPGMTVSGSFLGTPAYMSPEQIAAGRVKLDHRTDIYSLGAVLYELLTMRRPFPGDSREEVLSAIMAKDPRAPRRFNPRIPQDLETICLKALEKDPDRRYLTAKEFAGDLREYLRGGLITARRAGPVRRATTWMRRNRAATVAIFAAVVALIVGALAWTGWQGRSEEAAERSLANARLDWRAGRYQACLDNIARVLDLNPGSTEARRLRSMVLIEAARNQEAVDEAVTLFKDDPDDWVANLVLADLYHLDPTGISRAEHLRRVEAAAPESAEGYYVRSKLANSSTECSELLTRALELDPSYSEALVGRIQCNTQLKDFETALIDCERLIAVRPDSTQGRRMRAWVHSTRRDFASARNDIERAIEQDPEEYRNYWLSSGLFADVGNFTEAIDAFDRERSTSPDEWLPDLYWRKAEVEFAAGRFEDSVTTARAAIDRGSLAAYGTALKAYSSLNQENDLREAMDELREAIDASDASSAPLWRTLSTFDRSLGDYEKALADAELAVSLAPDEFNGYVDRARAKLSLGDEAGFREDCRFVASAEPWEVPDGAAAQYLVRRGFSLLGSCDDADAALEDFNLATELTPAWVDPYRARAVLRLQTGRLDDARSDLDRAVEIQPGAWRAYYDRGRLFLVLGDFSAALSDFNSAVRLGGDGGNLRWHQALAFLRLGRADEALETLDEAIALTPGSELGYRRRAKALFWLGRTDEAVATLNTAIEVRPAGGWPYLLRAAWLLNGAGSCGQAARDLEYARERARPWGETSLGSATNPIVRNARSVISEGRQFVDPTEVSSIEEGVSWLHAAYFFKYCPDLYDERAALESAKKAVQFNSKDGDAWTAFGLALYRNELYEEAREALSKALELDIREDVVALFPLAMTHWQLGSRREAAKYYDVAISRMRETYPDNPEYLQFMHEAAQVLGVTGDP